MPQGGSLVSQQNPDQSAGMAPLPGGAADLGGAPAQSGTTSAAGAPPDVGAGGANGGAETGGAPDHGDLLPVAPGAGDWMWQGQQRRLRHADGRECDAHIALGLNNPAVCFTADSGQLECFGEIYGQPAAAGFRNIGLSGADQILVSLSNGQTSAASLCVHTPGAVQCLGDYDDWGQFGKGDHVVSTTFLTWPLPEAVAIATGTWDQLCVLDAAGEVACSGNGFGATPMPQAGKGHHGVWVDPFGAAHVDDKEVVRAGEGRTECFVSPKLGLVCEQANYGPAGHVVTGGMRSSQPTFGDAAPCWLDDTGHVECDGSPALPFKDEIVLSLATSFYSDRVCAVLQDASLDCVSGDSQHLRTPAGSVRVDCR